MEEKRSEETKRKIGESLNATKARRLNQDIYSIELKIIESRLTAGQLWELDRIFSESKWVRNALIRRDEIFSYKYDEHRIVTHYTRDMEPIKSRITLRSIYHRSTVDQAKRDVRNLSKSKKKGQKVGELRYTSEVRSIEIKTGYFHIKGPDTVSIPGFTELPVYGLSQLDRFRDAEGNDLFELSTARLIKKASGRYVHADVCVDKAFKDVRPMTGRSTGLDFKPSGIVESSGRKHVYYQKESNRLKYLQKQMHRKQDGSKARNHLREQIGNEYEDAYNRKKEAAKRFVQELMDANDTVYFQDENIKGWKDSGIYSERIQHSYIGLVKKMLMDISADTKGVRAFCIQAGFPTTRWCPHCGAILDVKRDDTRVRCGKCNTDEERDEHAARNMKIIGEYLRAEYLGIPYEGEYKETVEELVKHYRKGQDKLISMMFDKHNE